MTAEPGRLGIPGMLVIGDATGGLPVRLPAGVPGPARGTLVEVRGTIANPYGQTELRAAAGGVTILGKAAPPTAPAVDAGDIGEGTEGRLVTVRGRVTASAVKSTGGDVALAISGEDGRTLRVLADGSAGLDVRSLGKGLVASFTGIVGQRASRKGALDGYRRWLRDRADVSPVTSSSPSQAPSPSASGLPSPSAAPVLPIATARLREGTVVSVEGALTTGSTLLDASGRRAVVEDATGAIEVYLETADASLHAGVRIRATGTVTRAYDALRLRVTQLFVLGAARPVASALSSAPTAAEEWQLVRVSGTVTDLHRLGSRWQAELQMDGIRVPVIGLEGSGIASSAVVVGRRATVVGIVRRPYPTAADRRFAVVPREPADVVLGPAEARPTSAAGRTTNPGASAAGTVAPGAGNESTGGGSAQDVDLARLGDHLGQVVRVGGLVTAVEADGVDLDDGTATVRIVLEGEAADLLALLEPGDALNAVGTAERRGEAVVVVEDPGGLVLVGDPGAGPGAPSADVADVSLRVSPLAGGGTAVRANIGSGFGLDPGPAGLGTLALLVTTSILVTAARRHRARRLIQARILARLDAFRQPTPAPGEESGM